MHITTWRPYHDLYSNDHHSVVGRIVVAQQVHSPQLGNRRNILVYLPPSYCHSERRYPVLYMHDGQNLFDKATSFAGEWGVDETMEQLSRERQAEAIIVGIPNIGIHRLDEYSPFRDKRSGGYGNLYVDFIVQTVKPLIDRDFRTQPGKHSTGLMGSSMGGLISLYAFFNRPRVFGFAGIMSPAFWFAHNAIYPFVESAVFHPGKIYLDAGTRELGGSWPERLTFRSRRYYASIRRMKRLLVKKGYRPVHDLLYVEEKWAQHNEAAWARRLPKAIEFFIEHARQA